MPCFRCAARQTDPTRGASPWWRAVLDGEQVLVCPGCQQVAGWDAPLDRCSSCGSVQLAKSLGAVRCRSCGAESVNGMREAGAQADRVGRTSPQRGGHPRSLPDEVAEALERVLQRSPVSDSPPSDVGGAA